MAKANPKQDFSKQINETRKSIKDRFKKSHEALVARENILLARVDSIEREYNQKIQLQNEIANSLRNAKSYNSENLKANRLTNAREQIITILDKQLAELTADTDTNIEFVWDNLFETDIEQLGSIKQNDQMNISPTRTFSPQVKPVVPDYKTKQLPTAYRCKKSSDKKSPGELNVPRCMSIHYKSGNIYIADDNIFFFVWFLLFVLISILTRYLAARYLNHLFNKTLYRYVVWISVQFCIVAFCSNKFIYIFSYFAFPLG